MVDATNLGVGGGTVLLKYLLTHLDQKSLRLLVSEKAASQFKDCSSIRVQSLNPIGLKRQSLLEKECNSFQPSSLLCFGNIPPSRSIETTKVVTYFHNAHLLSGVDHGNNYSLRDRLRYLVLRATIRRRRNLTDYWVFQTKAIRDAAISEHSINPDKVRVIPFYDDSELNAASQRNQQVIRQLAFTYVSNGRPHKNHHRLIQAWRILSERYDLYPELHLTVEPSNRSLHKLIDEAVNDGVKIKNHGELRYEAALDLIASCRFVVYPSTLETLGLGMIEGAGLGCDVLASDSSFLDDVVQASARFCAKDSLAIAKVVRDALTTELPRSQVQVSNQIKSMVELLSS